MRRTVATIAVLIGVMAPSPAVARSVEHHYVAVGDSITYGFGTSDPEKRAYPVVAGVQGHGVGGACVIVRNCPGLGILDWFETEVLAFSGRPRTAVALIGINDLNVSTPSPELVAGLKKLRRLARSMGVRLVFGTITPVARRSPWHSMQELRGPVNRWIRNQRQYVEYARAVENRNGWLKAEYDHDGLHLNDAGERALGGTLKRWLRADDR